MPCLPVPRSLFVWYEIMSAARNRMRVAAINTDIETKYLINIYHNTLSNVHGYKSLHHEISNKASKKCYYK